MAQQQWFVLKTSRERVRTQPSTNGCAESVDPGTKKYESRGAQCEIE